MAGEKAKLLCSFNGDFLVSKEGKISYFGGKTRLVSMNRSATFRTLLTKLLEISNAHHNPGEIDIRYQLPDVVGLDSRLISIENDEDVRNMMEEFDVNTKISIFLDEEMTGEKARLLCCFGGDFVSEEGKTCYVGGNKTHLVSMDRSATFATLLTKMSKMCNAHDRGVIDIRYRLPDAVGLDSRLISIENDEDVRNMMEEFGVNTRISIFYVF